MDLPHQRHGLLHSSSSTTLRGFHLRRAINLPCTNPQLRTRKLLLVKSATEGNGNPQKEVKLDSLDLMALEFGRLLGESKQKTLTKVIKRKLDPAASYVDIEKKTNKDRETASLNYQISTVGQNKDGLIGRVNKASAELPSLASPPARPAGSVRTPQSNRVTEEDNSNLLLRAPGLGNSLRKPIPKLPTAESNIHKTMVRKPFVSGDPEESSTSGLIENGSDLPKQNSEPVNEAATNTDPPPALPALAARPSRQKGSAGMFLSSARLRTPSTSNRMPINDTTDESLLRKPIKPADENNTHQDDLVDTSTIKSQAEDIRSADDGIAIDNNVLEGGLLHTSAQDRNKFVEKDESKNASSDQSHVKLVRPRSSHQSHVENNAKEGVASEVLEVPMQGIVLVEEEEPPSHSRKKSELSEHSNMLTAASSKVHDASHRSLEHEDSAGVKLIEGSNNGQTQSNVVESPKRTLRKPVQPFPLQPPRQKEIKASDTNWILAQEDEEKDWTKADELLKSKEQVEVKLIGSSSAGFFVSFGSLVGFLPLFELSSKRGLPDFASWAQQKGINLSVRRGSGNPSMNGSHPSSSGDTGTNTQTMDIKELRKKYNEDMVKQMSVFIGEKASVIVKLADKSTRRLKFSEKEVDPDSRELIKKKANLMSELKIGDTVTCEVKSITPIGVFVEIDGVSALIHQSEVSWNPRLDPSSIISIGEVIKARVCRLDRTLQRINLSLKQMQPDPLKLTLECVVGGIERDSTLTYVETTESKSVFWPELEDLIDKLEKIDEISSVTKGRCLRSAALAPSFQVFLSSGQSHDYKLVARLRNQIQEVFVKTTVDREKMKEYIRTCTFSVA